ncbi:MAG: hypothetical protein WED34_07710 [Planctomycetales bacterium]
MRTARGVGFVVIPALVVGLAIVERAGACPNCGPPKPALSQQMADADAVVLVQWIAARKPPEDDAPAASERSFPPEFPAGDPASADVGSTTYEIVRAARGESAAIRPGGRIELVRYRPGKKGGLFLLMGIQGTTLEWDVPVEISAAGFAYLEQSPAPDAPAAQRLEYFLKYLEFPDPLVAADAFQEFANAPYKDMLPLVDKMPRERLRKWIFDAETVPTRLNLYGMMLGLCGDETDEALLKKKILARSDEMRLEMPGIMSGYLTLAGDEGLALLEEEKLRPRYVEVEQPDGTLKRENQIPFSETYAALRAVQFLWDYERDRVAPERIKQSMRIVLERSDLADFAIADLARWKDWEIQDRVMELYGAKDFDAAAIKRAIIRYFLTCARDVPAGATTDPPHVAKAKAHLETLKKRDPKLVADVERFSFFE